MTPDAPYIIPSDSTSIYDQLSVLEKQAIVRPNNPPPGIAGFIFDISGDEELRLRSLITKHYVENNTPVQDMIAREPEEIKLRGVVAELSTGLIPQPPVSPPPDTLPLNAVLVPEPSAGQAQFDADQLPPEDPSVTSTQSLYAYQQSVAPLQLSPSAQANAAAYIYQLWLGGVLFSVETPFGIINNMAIQDAQMIQEAASRQRSNYTITFQKIRIVGDATIQPGQLEGRRAAQASPTTQNGVVGQTSVTPAAANALFQSFQPWSAAA